MTFTDEEIAYLRSQPLARFATLSADGQPDVVPLAFEFDGECFWHFTDAPHGGRTLSRGPNATARHPPSDAGAATSTISGSSAPRSGQTNVTGSKTALGSAIASRRGPKAGCNR